MVGLCGVVGGRESIDPLVEWLPWRGAEATQVYESDDLSVGLSLHEQFSEEQPVDTDQNDVSLWIWGELYGFEGPEGYRSKYETHPSETRGEYCAELCAEHGAGFVSGLNGEYVGIIHDRTSNVVKMFTDRLGSRGLYHARANDGGLVFSTKLQSLSEYPDLELEFEIEYLYEYFAEDRARGIETPLTGVKKVPPASVLCTDVEDGSTDVRSYWDPVYDPVDRPLSTIVDEFVDIYPEVLRERTAGDEDYGLLLSGGSDSRAILAGLEEPPHCFTMAGWMNREARIAERAALVSDADFTFLKRDKEYQMRALKRNPPLSNLIGRFQHAHATGFLDELTAEVDVLMAGQFCDTFFKGHFLPIPEFPLDQISTFDLPVEKPISSIREYVEHLTGDDRLPAYLETPPTLEQILRDNIVQDGSWIRSHGVRYPSLRELVLCSEYYPLTNQPDAFFYESLVQMMPYRSPFLDNRLIDLHLSIPVKYYLRRNLVDRAVTRLSPDLAAIPHSTTGVPLRYPFPIHYVGQKLSTLKRRFLPVDAPPKSHLRQTSWTDHKTLIRMTDYVKEAIARHETRIRACPFIEYETVLDVYQRHLAGEQRMPELYALLTFLEMPVARNLIADYESVDA